ncbi:dihydrofolate reductase family protein [Solicola sp. PLA-1-18]|uniref:dihydrofolate reductase family protein n=1 Tax=Solicola sp. PLA-1-18 TaxID=3380532 RepID=UPI003B794A22
MSRLVYSTIGSLDGYLSDPSGGFDWAMPDEEVMEFVNGQMRRHSTYLYGRRLYETMHVWETDADSIAQSPLDVEFASIWQAARKVVFSTTLTDVVTTRTTIERTLDADVVARLKDESDGDLEIGGPTLATDAFALGLVDEVHVIVVPVVVGGGAPLYPQGTRLDLRLVDQRTFGNGMVHLRYDVRR